jgi:hypothetical protein
MGRKMQHFIMTINKIKNEILARYEGLLPQDAWGETSYFYNPGNLLPKGTYFMTIKERDGENDKASKLYRDGVFRVNCGTVKRDFENLFGDRPGRPPKGGVIEGPWRFDEKDIIMPHPVYGWAGWVCVINPTKKTFEQLLKLSDNYYKEAVNRFNRKKKAK